MTRADQDHPTVRVVRSPADGDLIAEIYEFDLVLRPVRARRGGPAEVRVSWSAIYLHAMTPAPARRITRGVRP